MAYTLLNPSVKVTEIASGGRTHAYASGKLVTIIFDHTITTTSTYETIATLPAGYAPPYGIYAKAMIPGNTTSDARCAVDTTGKILAWCNTASRSYGNISYLVP